MGQTRTELSCVVGHRVCSTSAGASSDRSRLRSRIVTLMRETHGSRHGTVVEDGQVWRHEGGRLHEFGQ